MVQPPHSALTARSTPTKASWGMFTGPIAFLRFHSSFCFSRSVRFLEMSPPWQADPPHAQEGCFRLGDHSPASIPQSSLRRLSRPQPVR